MPPHAPAPMPRVLVIDDDPMTIATIDGALRREHTVQVALDGNRGLTMATRHTVPDIILLDLVMPGLDGYEVCDLLRKNPVTHHVPIIVLTGRHDEQSEVRAFDLGASDFVTKPINVRLLHARVRAHLSLTHYHKTLEARVRERTREIQDLQLGIIQRLSRAAEFRDNETGLHVVRMSHYAHRLALACGLDHAAADVILQAAPMHDVGKIGVPDHILLKPGRLTEEEFDVIRRHPAIGAEILGQHPSELMDVARLVALTHHEKWDGSGYPAGLAGNAIPEVGRIVAVADVFDALTSPRPYKAAWSVEQALGHIAEQRGRHFEPRLVDCFLNIVPELLEIRAAHPDDVPAPAEDA